MQLKNTHPFPPIEHPINATSPRPYEIFHLLETNFGPAHEILYPGDPIFHPPQAIFCPMDANLHPLYPITHP